MEIVSSKDMMFKETRRNEMGVATEGIQYNKNNGFPMYSSCAINKRRKGTKMVSCNILLFILNTVGEIKTFHKFNLEVSVCKASKRKFDVIRILSCFDSIN
ncbi:CLUMA_CG005243, isoform A [Clunio marinus]|uniref:CLUMA_CG005243, isoform A n=1 Tax=Clunio marinus TaxID=568069 RepID=A0A1J1HUA8_9DIPT|nr:CLUMA_CG005243, isoform A [Clunio marinus]